MCKGFMSVHSQLQSSYHSLPSLGVNIMCEAVGFKLPTEGHMTTEWEDNHLKVNLLDLCGGRLRGLFL